MALSANGALAFIGAADASAPGLLVAVARAAAHVAWAIHAGLLPALAAAVAA